MANEPNPTISVAEAAEMLGVSTKTAYTLIHRQNISTIVRRGTCEPKTAVKLANGLGVAVTEILEEE